MRFCLHKRSIKKENNIAVLAKSNMCLSTRISFTVIRLFSTIERYISAFIRRISLRIQGIHQNKAIDRNACRVFVSKVIQCSKSYCSPCLLRLLITTVKLSCGQSAYARVTFHVLGNKGISHKTTNINVCHVFMSKVIQWSETC